MTISEGACQRAAVLCDRHSGAERFVPAGSRHLGEDAWMGKKGRIIQLAGGLKSLNLNATAVPRRQIR